MGKRYQAGEVDFYLNNPANKQQVSTTTNNNNSNIKNSSNDDNANFDSKK